MNRLRLLLISIFLLFYVVPAQADTHYATTCSPADVQAAVNAASPGDSVELPTCDYTNWNSQVTVNDPIILYGQGVDSTRIKRSGGSSVMIRVNNVTGFEMYGMTVEGLTCGAGDQVYDHGLFLSGRSVDFKIHNNYFTCLGVGVRVDGNGTFSRGVIYQNTFVQLAVNGHGYGVEVDGDSVDGNLDLGSNVGVYIEDNYFELNRHAVASNDSSRYVFRFNEAFSQVEGSGVSGNGQSIDAHGLALHPTGSARYEIHNNWTHEPVSRGWYAIMIRGGDGVIFDNLLEDRSGGIRLTNDEGCNLEYPATDQILNLYIWGNDSDSGTNDINDSCAVVGENRDYYVEHPTFDGTAGVGVGIAANMPAACTSGVAYWATDEGEWNSLEVGPDGRLYRCIGTDAWQLFYTPYPYPHPLRGAAEVDTEPPSVAITAPSP